MTQVVRQKWVLAVASANALLALAVMAVVGVGLMRVREGDGQTTAAREEELRSVRGELERIRGTLQELHSPPADPQLAQTLQVIASEQQLLLLRSLQAQTQLAAPSQAATTAAVASKATRPSSNEGRAGPSRRPSARRARRLRPGCRAR